ncbi:MAG: hypothetical protein KF805_09440 [Phycisphaeraceae bacterium]|nr:hypothetical protein [Phycisphaeraceae bacterium]
MRIPGRKIWRAFRELDEFSDEQCRRFVKRAWGGWVIRVLASVLVIGTFAATFLIVASVMIWVHRSLDLDNRRTFSDLQITFSTAVVVVVVCTAAPLMALLARDFVLRAFIWRVLNIGGVCSECGYALYGLAVSEGMACSCPECGAVTQVDPALVELVRNKRGVTVAQRKRSAGRDPGYFWTPRKLKIAARVFLTAFVVLFVIPAGVLGVNELIVRIEARRAKGRFTSAKTLSGVLGLSTAVVLFEDQTELTGVRKIDLELQKLYNTKGLEVAAQSNLPQSIVMNESPAAWEFAARAKAPASDATAAQVGQYEADRKRDIWRSAVVAAMEGKDLRDAMRAIGASDPIHEPVPVIGSRDGGQVRLQFTWGVEFAGKLAIERMRLAAEEGNHARFEESLRAALSVIGHNSSIPVLGGWWSVSRLEAFLWSSLREAIVVRPEWAAGARAIVEAKPFQPDLVKMIEVERLVERDSILSILSNPDMVRFNRFTPELVRTVGGGGPLPPGRVGWVGENIAMNDRLFDIARAQAEAPPWNRPAVPALASDLVLAPVTRMAWGWFLPSFDWSAVNRAGMRVWLAIEQFRVKEGRLPRDLQEVELSQADRVDPLSGKAWVYVVNVNAKTLGEAKPSGGYLLYSKSTDGVDDFGRTGDPTILVSGGWGWRMPALAGRDVLINAELK